MQHKRDMYKITRFLNHCYFTAAQTTDDDKQVAAQEREPEPSAAVTISTDTPVKKFSCARSI